MKDKRKAEEIAAERMQLLAPLFEANCDPAKNRALRAQICAQAGISGRTLRRYLKEYQRHGFDGLKPKGKGRETSKAISPEVLEQAVLLRLYEFPKTRKFIKCPPGASRSLSRSSNGKASLSPGKLSAAHCRIG